MKLTIICRRATFFTDSEMIEYYPKKVALSSKSMKTKNYVTYYGRYTMLKNHLLWFMLGHMAVMRMSK